MPNGGYLHHSENLSEADIIRMYITPAIAEAGWDLNKQVREEVTFTDGRVKVHKVQVWEHNDNMAEYYLGSQK